jgi:hypothetical protein
MGAGCAWAGALGFDCCGREGWGRRRSREGGGTAGDRQSAEESFSLLYKETCRVAGVVVGCCGVAYPTNKATFPRYASLIYLFLCFGIFYVLLIHAKKKSSMILNWPKTQRNCHSSMAFLTTPSRNWKKRNVPPNRVQYIAYDKSNTQRVQSDVDRSPESVPRQHHGLTSTNEGTNSRKPKHLCMPSFLSLLNIYANKC